MMIHASKSQDLRVAHGSPCFQENWYTLTYTRYEWDNCVLSTMNMCMEQSKSEAGCRTKHTWDIMRISWGYIRIHISYTMKVQYHRQCITTWDITVKPISNDRINDIYGFVSKLGIPDARWQPMGRAAGAFNSETEPHIVGDSPSRRSRGHLWFHFAALVLARGCSPS